MALAMQSFEFLILSFEFGGAAGVVATWDVASPAIPDGRAGAQPTFSDGRRGAHAYGATPYPGGGDAAPPYHRQSAINHARLSRLNCNSP